MAVPPGAVRLGTRGSALAVAQSTAVAHSLEALGVEVELIRIVTSGDRARAVGDKGRFVKEIEQALLAGEIDLAVHSAKDVPGELPDGLEIVGVPERADPRDALCLPAAAPGDAAPGLEALSPGAVVGTASLRRRAQLLAVRRDLDIRELRGNVDTRLGRLADGELDAIVLAAAGLARLDRAGAGTAIPDDLLVPAPGQGCLALEARADDARVRELAERLTDHDALTALTAERALVTGIDATCHTPVGAYATFDDATTLRLRTFVGAPDGSAWARDEVTAPRDDPAALGADAAQRLLAAGARHVLAAAESWTA